MFFVRAVRIYTLALGPISFVEGREVSPEHDSTRHALGTAHFFLHQQAKLSLSPMRGDAALCGNFRGVLAYGVLDEGRVDPPRSAIDRPSAVMVTSVARPPRVRQ